MMKFAADLHTHTLASDHAYSTILENARCASEAGLRYLGWTDHSCRMVDGPHLWHFLNIHSVPDMLEGVRILKGVEADIVDFSGTLDMSDQELSGLEWVIASIHGPMLSPGTAEEHSAAYLGAAENPNVDVIGHSGYADYPYDYEKAVKRFRELGKLVEINNHSFTARQKSIANCVTLARLCKKYECRIVVSSDAHFAAQIGQLDRAVQMLEEIDFPTRLILNADEERVAEYMEERRKRLGGR